MTKPLLRTDKEFTEVYEHHVNTVWHICLAYMKNIEDSKDAVQETFLKLLRYQGEFTSDEHIKAWLIVTASNYCKDLLKHWWRKRENIDDYERSCIQAPFEIDTTLEEVMKLPDKYKIVVYLYYYEGYDTTEIAGMLHKPKSTVRNYLCKARSILKTKLGGEFDEK